MLHTLKHSFFYLFHQFLMKSALPVIFNWWGRETSVLRCNSPLLRKEPLPLKSPLPLLSPSAGIAVHILSIYYVIHFGGLSDPHPPYCHQLSYFGIPPSPCITIILSNFDIPPFTFDLNTKRAFIFNPS